MSACYFTLKRQQMGLSSIVNGLCWFIFGALFAYIVLSHTRGGQSSSREFVHISVQHDDSLFRRHQSDLQKKVAEVSKKLTKHKSSSSKQTNNQTTNSTADFVERLLTGSYDDAGQADVAEVLSQSVRILCLVLTTASYHESRALPVKNTWGSRCTKLVFISDEANATIGAIAASTLSEYSYLWSKTRGGFRWAYEHISEFDWVIKADDDTYVVMENMRAMLFQYNPNEEWYFGHSFENKDWNDPRAYTSGGAGYVLSRRAVVRLVEEAFALPLYCAPASNAGAEDVEMGRCLEHLGIKPSDSRDDKGRQRFMVFSPSGHLTVGSSPPDMWIWTFEKYPYVEGEGCCSNIAISFHYITPDQMVVMEYLIYRLRPFGIRVFRPDAKYDSTLSSIHALVSEKLTINNYTTPAAVTERPPSEFQEMVTAATKVLDNY